MLDKIFLAGFVELAIACVLYLIVLRLQLNALKNQSNLQSLKRLLIVAVIFLILASIPLMFVYANALWFHKTAVWILPFAVLGNATSKVVEALILYRIYNFKQ